MSIFVQQEFQAAKLHQFEPADTPSITRRLFSRVWAIFAKFFPIWIDPKLILFPGLMLQFFTFLLVCLSSNFMAKGVDTLTCILSGLCDFIYVFMKGVSGRQARRAEVFPSLQIYFEKACDHIMIPLEALKFMTIIRLGRTGRTVYGMGYVGID